MPDFCCHALAVLAAVPASHCVDDALVSERLDTIESGWVLWRAFADLAGWDVPDVKSPPPSQVGRILVAASVPSNTPTKSPILAIAEDRKEQLAEVLREVLRVNHLASGLAGKIWGRLSFACTQVYGRLGRAKLNPFSRRQHELSQHRLNTQLRKSMQWWIEEMPGIPPRPIPSLSIETKTVISYWDGEGSGAQV